MTNCAKCGAELIGSRKFCAACGAPTDPASLKRAEPPGGSGPASSPAPQPGPQINVPSTAYGPPMPAGSPPVNPFAATASPASRAMGSPYGPPPATTSNPPSGPPPGDGTAPVPPVSPLAVSNALSQRGAFQQAAGDKIPPSAPSSSSSKTGTSPPPPPAKKAPGTQLMPSIPNPGALGGPRSGSSPPGSNTPGAAPAKPPPQRTQVMDAAAFARLQAAKSGPAAAPSAPNQPAAQPIATPAAQPIATPATPAVPPSILHQPQPPSIAHQPPPPTVQPYSHGHASPQAPPPGQWGAPAAGWGAPHAPAAAPGGYGGFGYSPGARVNVTWSNGQRYPATVAQVSGNQVLVAFPDGQQHWVEMQYLSPG